MKATELMISDWVQSKAHDGKILYTKIEALDVRGTTKHILSSNRWIDDDEFEPIPLTSAILEKNGFRNDNPEFVFRNESVLVKIRLGRFCKFDITTDKCYYATSNIIHVHELQRALRLCGQNNLADNFKI